MDKPPATRRISLAVIGTPDNTARACIKHCVIQKSRVKLPDASGLTVGCTLAQKIGAPASIRPAVWSLRTNQEADDIEVVVKLIPWYRARWEIEMFRHVLTRTRSMEAKARVRRTGSKTFPSRPRAEHVKCAEYNYATNPGAKTQALLGRKRGGYIRVGIMVTEQFNPCYRGRNACILWASPNHIRLLATER
jgi:hypothetical protein